MRDPRIQRADWDFSIHGLWYPGQVLEAIPHAYKGRLYLMSVYYVSEIILNAMNRVRHKEEKV